MSEVEWRGRTVPVKIDKVRIFLLGLADNEAAIVQVRGETHGAPRGVRSPQTQITLKPFRVRVRVHEYTATHELTGFASTPSRDVLL